SSRIYADISEAAPPALHKYRTFNIRSQEDEQGDGCRTWPHLEAFSGSLVDVYLFGITCRIRRVHMNGSVHPRLLKLLPPVLAYAQPQHLKIQGDSMLLLHPAYGMIKLLRESCAARLESLMLRLDLRSEDLKGLSIPSVLNDLADSLKCLPLRRLRLRINGTGLNPPIPARGDFMFAPYYGNLPSAPAWITELEKSLRSVDVDAYARDLASAIPSLEDVVVDVMGERDDAFVYRTRVAELVRRRSAEYADRRIYEW
ncbi:hypothetical protein C8T65DRAFT_671072, partial [Cerioporus squamosus]